jgi:hypothetical protein
MRCRGWRLQCLTGAWTQTWGPQRVGPAHQPMRARDGSMLALVIQPIKTSEVPCHPVSCEQGWVAAAPSTAPSHPHAVSSGWQCSLLQLAIKYHLGGVGGASATLDLSAVMAVKCQLWYRTLHYR